MDLTQKKLLIALEETGMFTQEQLADIKNGKLSIPKIIDLVARIKTKLFHPRHTPEVSYVVGVATNPEKTHALLVLKNRPTWQEGLLNGVGGKIEDGETAIQAMIREFREETGIKTDFSSVEQAPTWRFVGRRQREALVDKQPGSYALYIFSIELPLAQMKDADRKSVSAVRKNKTNEQIICLPLNLEILRRKGVPGLAWLVDIALCSEKEAFSLSIDDFPNFIDCEDHEG